MEVVTDTSSIIAVILNEATKPTLIELTQGANFTAPHSIPWEIGNALSAMFKRKRITLEQAKAALQIYQEIPITFVDVQLESAVEIAEQLNIYAYDAYLLTCALQRHAPLISLDKGLIQSVKILNITVLEIEQ
ncbi:type II toxin-antitoxin system VapC family toxin [Candidatus Parabeggiatoa sp. HSG14]|uniref:type II toxin-antitoxin system VapC family toxin n=1 Tax=Candidatus Parabeggiatoa sp. HSG14 TaxID=3055593 RepID=UPI0025A6B941|nr:type II toxin-antitoxin system VapC family toxin [Thiotrichales bacterium HSG14]